MNAPTAIDLRALIVAAVEADPGEYVTLASDGYGHRLAESIVDQIPAELHRTVLVNIVVGSVWAEHRNRAHRVEREARRKAPSPTPEPTPKPEPLVSDEFQRLYADPAVWNMDRSGKSIWRDTYERRRKFSTRFRRWCNETHAEDGGYNGWLQRGTALFGDPATHDDMADFAQDFLPKPVRDGYHRGRILQFVQDYATQLRFEITAELLDSVFATGDGTKVSWRDATIEQHQERVELLTKMIGGTAETAAMHIKAVAMIRSADARTLGDLAANEAA